MNPTLERSVRREAGALARHMLLKAHAIESALGYLHPSRLP